MILDYCKKLYCSTVERDMPETELKIIKKAICDTKINVPNKHELYAMLETYFVDMYRKFGSGFEIGCIKTFINLGIITFDNNTITNFDIFEIKSHMYHFDGRGDTQCFTYNKEHLNDPTKKIFIFSDKHVTEQRKYKSAPYLRILKGYNKTVEKYLGELMKKYNYVPNQEMFDYCFKYCDNEIFTAMDNIQIPSNIKFTSEHMTLVCEHGNTNMLKFLLDQKLVPSADNVRAMLFNVAEADQNILELLKGYGVLLPNMFDTINFNKKIEYSSKTLMKLDMLKILESDMETSKKKYFTKGTAKNMESNGSIEALQLAFLFDYLDNIKKFMDKHKVEPDLTCLSNSILNENNNVTLWIEKTYNYKPSVVHILKSPNWNTRAYLLNKHYPELCDLTQYNAQTIGLKNKPIVIDTHVNVSNSESDDEVPVKKQKVIKTKQKVICKK